MSRVRFLLLIVLAVPVTAGADTRCVPRTTVDIGVAGYTLESRGRAWIEDYSVGPIPCSAEIASGVHRITNDRYAIVKEKEWADTTPNSQDTSWDSELAASGQIDVCYRASISLRQSDGQEQGAGTEALCLRAPTPPPPPPDNGDGDSGEATFFNYGSPILIDLGSATYPLTSVDRGVSFDIDADGDLERVSWTRDASVAFLFFDRDGDGLPANGAELFGDHTPLASGAIAAHGFQALAEFDGNGDGAVTPADARWPALRLWQDANHDGRADAGEITTLDAASIRALGTVPAWNGRRDRHGNLFQWKSLASVGGQQRPFYDVYFVTE